MIRAYSLVIGSESPRLSTQSSRRISPMCVSAAASGPAAGPSASSPSAPSGSAAPASRPTSSCPGCGPPSPGPGAAPALPDANASISRRVWNCASRWSPPRSMSMRAYRKRARPPARAPTTAAGPCVTSSLCSSSVSASITSAPKLADRSAFASALPRAVSAAPGARARLVRSSVRYASALNAELAAYPPAPAPRPPALRIRSPLICVRTRSISSASSRLRFAAASRCCIAVAMPPLNSSFMQSTSATKPALRSVISVRSRVSSASCRSAVRRARSSCSVRRLAEASVSTRLSSVSASIRCSRLWSLSFTSRRSSCRKPLISRSSECERRSAESSSPRSPSDRRAVASAAPSPSASARLSARLALVEVSSSCTSESCSW